MKELPPVETRELLALSRKFGTPRRVIVPLGQWPMPRLARGDRRGEVVFAIRNGTGQVLLHTKRFYPQGVFRLPGGGIKRDEAVEDALLREVEEETGLAVRIETFAALIEYEVRRRRQLFATYVFLLLTERLEPTVHDPNEKISEFKNVSLPGLRATAEQLRSLPENWRAWGMFRAAAHDLAAAAIDARKAKG